MSATNPDTIVAIRALMVGGEDRWGESLVALLQSMPGFEVTDHARSPAELAAILKSKHPNLVIIDSQTAQIEPGAVLETVRAVDQTIACLWIATDVTEYAQARKNSAGFVLMRGMGIGEYQAAIRAIFSR